MSERSKALEELLQPITWYWGSTLDARRAAVIERQERVSAAYPFLMADEKVLADEWLEKEAHEGLWE